MRFMSSEEPPLRWALGSRPSSLDSSEAAAAAMKVQQAHLANAQVQGLEAARGEQLAALKATSVSRGFPHLMNQFAAARLQRPSP